MSPRFLLDTNTVIYIRQRRPAPVRSRFESLPPGEAALSVITFGELMHGVEKSQNRDVGLATLRKLTSLIPVVPLPSEAGETYRKIRATLERGCNPIGNNDLWIAAHAKSAGLILVTNNMREFRRVSGLQLENWAA